MPRPMGEWIGRRFGRLKVVSLVKPKHCLCDCDCGTKNHKVRRSHLPAGNIQSCGCLATSVSSAVHTVHGGTNTPEHRSYMAMLSRCFNTNHHAFDRYGGRGITVCDRWRHDFSAFREYVGDRPSPKHSIDRWPDTNGNYEPGNVRWATKSEQARNRRSNSLITLNGITATVAEWSQITGIRRVTIAKRKRDGFEPERILSKSDFRNKRARI